MFLDMVAVISFEVQVQNVMQQISVAAQTNYDSG